MEEPKERGEERAGSSGVFEGGVSTSSAPGEGFPMGKKGKAFRLFQRKGFQRRGGVVVSNVGGFRRARKAFPARASREWWCSNGVTGCLCKGDEGPADMAFLA